jgi:hypothetical protein
MQYTNLFGVEPIEAAHGFSALINIVFGHHYPP